MQRNNWANSQPSQASPQLTRGKLIAFFKRFIAGLLRLVEKVYNCAELVNFLMFMAGLRRRVLSVAREPGSRLVQVKERVFAARRSVGESLL